MKREEVKAQHAGGQIFATHVLQNPANPKQWIVLFKQNAGRSFFLVDEREEVESFVHLDDVVEALRALGLKLAEIHF